MIALEEGVITPAESNRVWNGKSYPVQAWNHDQNLSSAMSDSVNWYFQRLDQATGRKKLENYFASIGYGNEDFSGGLSSFWLESSLKISPVEQVQMLKAMNENKLGFHKESTNAIKDVLFAGEHQGSKLYGKTGTGTVNGKDINGWFVGFVVQADNTYYFAVNVQDENGKANGRSAMKIAKQILRDKHIYD
ncbi:penicillin-binding transpeptidase domain-containing protein [Virgibacillus sp. 179-BFC.A HS]|uniref:beta-lactamase n=1 Tax=Tigheibacillus jepli TaxID=3035914 RepID=A0ABU5CEN6_9BACI|nr:penicillin-binding transpeptidase domain-containing protein [Virgibacillus sp. 179-BFC.A HS]MDY0404773.1 penicillin-binding transpeptidase domain-containing protein [Virgibacillus sp. 179-BFC.A HS]